MSSSLEGAHAVGSTEAIVSPRAGENGEGNDPHSSGDTSPIPFHPTELQHYNSTEQNESNSPSSRDSAVLQNGQHHLPLAVDRPPNQPNNQDWRTAPLTSYTSSSLTYYSPPATTTYSSHPPPIMSAPSCDSGGRVSHAYHGNHWMPAAPQPTASFESHGSNYSSSYITPPPVVTTYSYGHPHPPPMYAYNPHPGASPYPYPPPPYYCAPPPPLQVVEYIYDVQPSDVLCGRGGATNSHSGNRAFRVLVKRHQQEYLQAKKRDKPNVADKIVDLIRERGGRFLRRCEGIPQGQAMVWVDIGNERAREKTCQALREGAPELRRARRKRRQVHLSSSSTFEDEDESVGVSNKNEIVEEDWISSMKSFDGQSNKTRPESGDNSEEESCRREGRDDVEVGGSYEIRPSVKLLKSDVSERIFLHELPNKEQALYTSSFVPPRSSTERKSSRNKTIYPRARPIAEEVDSSEATMESIKDDDAWTGAFEEV